MRNVRRASGGPWFAAPILLRFDYQEDGGWYLAEDEVHSRYDEPLQLPDKGMEIWGP